MDSIARRTCPKGALPGLSEHSFDFAASFAWRRLMNKHKVGSDCFFSDLGLPKCKAHLSRNFVQFVVGQWQHSIAGLTRHKISDPLAATRRTQK